MQIEPSKLRALAEMDNARFAAMLRIAAKAVGLSAEQAELAAQNAPAFRDLLQNASDEELQGQFARLKSSPEEYLRNMGGRS